MDDPDPQRVERAFRALVSMSKNDTAAIHAGADDTDGTDGTGGIDSTES